MKDLNEGRILHTKSQTSVNEFHAPSFPCHTRKSLPLYCSSPPIKDNLSTSYYATRQFGTGEYIGLPAHR